MPEAVVVGAGPAGLAVAAQLRRRGLAAVILERGDALGASWRARYDGLRLNTYRAFSHLPGMRLPRDAGRYATREAFIAYLDRYARDNDLEVRLGVEAQRIERDRDHGWTVVCPDGPVASPNVVVATGWDAAPHLPEWTTESVFAGQLLHTSQVRDLHAFADQRVLVVGAGNSGIDLAGLLVRAGASVTVSMRTPPNIFPRDWLGVPLGPIVLIAEHLPSGPTDLIGRFIQWQRYGNLTSFGDPIGAPRVHDGLPADRNQSSRRRRLRQLAQVRPLADRRPNRAPGPRRRDPGKRGAPARGHRDLRDRLPPRSAEARRAPRRARRSRRAALPRRRALQPRDTRSVLRRLPHGAQWIDTRRRHARPPYRQGDHHRHVSEMAGGHTALMCGSGPSRTARMAAVARALHLFAHGPRALLTDWLAWPLVGCAAETIAAGSPAVLGDLQEPFMTWFAARSRITEDWLAASGAGQYVILGAGLDSFAWRQQSRVRVFEVDRPATQAWKAARVAALGLHVPEELVWVPVDFEQQRLGEGLADAGLKPAEELFVSWLGVIPYLTEDAITATLRELPPCLLTVAYVPPADSWDAVARRLALRSNRRYTNWGSHGSRS